MIQKIKEGMRKQYHQFGWEFANWLDWKPQLRGNSKKKRKHIFNKLARRNKNKIISKELNELS